jgi:hypothetical protein
MTFATEKPDAGQSELSDAAGRYTEIRLPSGDFMVVDTKDIPTISRYVWSHRQGDTTKYVSGRERGVEFKKRKLVALHRILLGAIGKNVQVDHINGNGLDNRRVNIRLCTPSQNQGNRRTMKRGKSSRFKGVIFVTSPKKRPWKAQIGLNGKNISIGYFAEESDAAKAYDSAAKKLFGEFAFTNEDLLAYK